MHEIKISRRRFELEPEAVAKQARTVLPEPVQEHFVVIDGRRYPPKQVISLVTGLDRADFTSHQARRILLRLGFPAARRSASSPRPSSNARCRGPHGGRGADALRPYIGQWVATRGHEEVLVAADTPREVVGWLARHGVRADSMFRVPESDAAAAGAAPA